MSPHFASLHPGYELGQMKSLPFAIFLFGLAIAGARAQSAVQPVHADTFARQITRTIVTRGDTRIEVLSQGAGPLIVLLPSLGRGAEDFDAIAVHLALAGFRVLRRSRAGSAKARARSAASRCMTTRTTWRP